MRGRILFVVVCLLIPTLAFADEIFIPIAGSVGVFSTDARIVNPAGDAEITIQAYLLPDKNVDNSGVEPREITIPAREMAVYDNVVGTLFEAQGLAAIRLVSESSFNATARIFAQGATGTLGQFVLGVPVGNAMPKGLLLQLKASGDFRTNVGMVNPNGETEANVTLYLYAADNSVVASWTETLQPFGVIGPTNISGRAPGADLSDAWIAYESDQPVIVYGSVVDNRTTDPTYVPAVLDTGSVPPPQAKTRTFDVTAFQWGYVFRENGKLVDPITIEKDTKVVLRFTSQDVTHGFQLSPFISSILIQPGATKEVEFVADQEGTFNFFCTNFCGEGHPGMGGSLQIGKGVDPGGGGGYSKSPVTNESSTGQDHAHHHQHEGNQPDRH